MFIHFDTIHERDRRTHTHTERHRMTEKKTVTSIVKKLVISWQWLWDYVVKVWANFDQNPNHLSKNE